MIFTWLNYYKKSTRLLKICADLIEKYEKNSPYQFIPSCKSDLLELIKKGISKEKQEIAEWKDCETDYIKIAHTLLVHATFDLLASGYYHMYAGLLSTMNCAYNLEAVYKASMEWAVMMNYIDEETKEKEYKKLRTCISKMG